MTSKLRLALEDATLARQYLMCATRALGPDFAHDDTVRFIADMEMMDPCCFLVVHAIEVGLNAYLQSEGIKGGRGNHDLVARLAAAEKAGLAVTERFRKSVIAIAPAHAAGQFRYARANQEGFISPRALIQVVEPVIEAINTHVVEKTLAEEGVRPDGSAV